MTTRTHTLAASLIALMTAAPAIAQQGGSGQQDQQTGAATQEPTGATQQAQTERTDREMPEAATPQGQGLSDIATVDRPQGEVGAQPQGQQGRMVMLDVQNFGERIYERGFRQGYIHGLAEARERFMSRAEQAQSMGEGLRAQQDRAESAVGGQVHPAPTQRAGGGQQTAATTTEGEEERQQGARQAQAEQQTLTEQSARTEQRAGTDEPARTEQTAQQQGRTGDRGTIIVLPPGVTPAMFIEELREAHDSRTEGG